MRPVGSPKHAVREFLDHAPGEGNDVAIGVASPFSAGGPGSESRSGQETLLQTLACSRMNFRNRENSGPSIGFVTSGRPMWSTTTVVGSAVKKSQSSGRSTASK